MLERIPFIFKILEAYKDETYGNYWLRVKLTLDGSEHVMSLTEEDKRVIFFQSTTTESSQEVLEKARKDFRKLEKLRTRKNDFTIESTGKAKKIIKVLEELLV